MTVELRYVRALMLWRCLFLGQENTPLVFDG